VSKIGSEFVCEQCGSRGERRSPRQQFCSARCRAADWRGRQRSERQEEELRWARMSAEEKFEWIMVYRRRLFPAFADDPQAVGFIRRNLGLEEAE
jgi:endogenous inhibitor of DNA gyrase (YacG/DUF329 family)